MIITSIEDLKSECMQMQEFLDVSVSDDINEVVDRGWQLSVYMSRSGKMLADAKWHVNSKIKSGILEIIKDILGNSYSAKIQNSLVDSIAIEERYLVDWIDRINRACVHQMDWCRTVVSKEKEMMKHGV